MKIGDLFETRVEEKIEPVIKVAEMGDQRKLAAEIGGYVVTPLIERVMDDFLEQYTDSFLTETTEIGVWISGYFGSGKSHLAKMMALVAGNPTLLGTPACDRFVTRVPVDAPRRTSIQRSLQRMGQCRTRTLSFNINTLSTGNRSLATLLASQYYQSRGYTTNVLYAKVIESELDRHGKLQALHEAAESRAGAPWSEIMENVAFYRTPLYQAVCDVAPELFPNPADVDRSLRQAEQGELVNVEFLVRTLLADLDACQRQTHVPHRLLLVLDESGQWIGNDGRRLADLQALVEEAAVKGQGRLWIVVTTHADLGSVYREARALDGDMKKIEGRFRFRPMLTTENIELVLEDRLLRKKGAGDRELRALYGPRGGVLRGVGELANTSQTLPSCTEDRFVSYYPFFPYQIHLIPEIVKALRSKGGRGEQMSGSTRTLLGIAQDILRSGRREYLDEPPGAMVSFDEVYHNLAGEGEVSPDVRTELSRVGQAVPGATALTPRVAEVLYLVHHIGWIPRTIDNIARLLVEDVSDDVGTVRARMEPELERLVRARLVARIGDEYEFLTGERRSFEEEVANVEAQEYGRFENRERGLRLEFVHEAGKALWRRWLDSNTVSFRSQDFPFRLEVDGQYVPGTEGRVTLKFYTPLGARGRVTLPQLENDSLHPDEKHTLLFLSGAVRDFEQDLARLLAMKEVIGNWIGSQTRSPVARELAAERRENDVPKLEARVLDGFKEAIRTGWLVFRGASRALALAPAQKPSDALRHEMAAFWPTIYAKFDKVPVRVADDQRAIREMLAGAASPSADVRQLKLLDAAGRIDANAPLLDAIRVHLAKQQADGHAVTGKSLIEAFEVPPYGWDPNAVRVGVAALVRLGALKVLVNKKALNNPADRELVDALRVSRTFEKVELVLEEVEVPQEVLTETRTFLIRLSGNRNVDETPAALSEAADELAAATLEKAETVRLWAAGSKMPLSAAFVAGEDAWSEVAALSSPAERVRYVHANRDALEAGWTAIDAHHSFEEQHRTAFTELSSRVTDLGSIEHLLPASGPLRELLEEYDAARAAATFTDKDTWKRLQTLQGHAVLELSPLLDTWRQDARRQLEAALTRLPADLAERGLAGGLATTLGLPLVTLLEALGADASPARIAALPDRAARVVRELGDRIGVELRRPTGITSVPPPAGRKLRRLRASEVTPVTKVRDEEEWKALAGKLDAHVRRLLAEGYDVEFE